MKILRLYVNNTVDEGEPGQRSDDPVLYQRGELGPPHIQQARQSL